MSGPDLHDYIEVPERIAMFYEQYPEGVICTGLFPDGKPYALETIGDRTYLTMVAYAYRTVDDPHPAVGTVWEPVPGKTPYTRDSEPMNAETSAWGRAIAALGIGTKRSIASANEVRSRQEPAKPGRETPPPPAPADTLDCEELITEPQEKLLHVLAKKHPDAYATEREAALKRNGVTSLKHLTKAQASALIDALSPKEA